MTAARDVALYALILVAALILILAVALLFDPDDRPPDEYAPMHDPL